MFIYIKYPQHQTQWIKEKIAVRRQREKRKSTSGENRQWTLNTHLFLFYGLDWVSMWIILREGEINKNQNRTPTIWDLLPSLLLLVYSLTLLLFFGDDFFTLSHYFIRIHMPVTPPHIIFKNLIWFQIVENENSQRDHCHSHSWWLVV